MIYTIGARDPRKKGDNVINTTSRSKNWSQGLSPFILGPVPLWDGMIAQNVENAWQYTKVYPSHVDEDGDPTHDWICWAVRGWEKRRAVRYPMGKGAKPLYSYWDDEKLDYIEARKRIYLPAYANAVTKTDAFTKLQETCKEHEDIWLWDFDCYRHDEMGMTLSDVLHDGSRSMGHGFILKMILTGEIDELAPGWKYLEG